MFAQFVADMFAVNPEDVRIIDGDTARTPFGMGSFASRSTVIVGHTAARAGTILRDKVKAVAAMLLRTPAESLELVDGSVAIKGAPHDGRPLSSTLGHYILTRATDQPTVEIEHLETPSTSTPGGMKGMGEGSALATPAAIACAVFDAIGPAAGTIEAMPLTTEAISNALADARAARAPSG